MRFSSLSGQKGRSIELATIFFSSLPFFSTCFFLRSLNGGSRRGTTVCRHDDAAGVESGGPAYPLSQARPKTSEGWSGALLPGPLSQSMETEARVDGGTGLPHAFGESSIARSLSLLFGRLASSSSWGV